MDNKKSDTKDRWKIQTTSNGNPLTYNQCELIHESDPAFVMFRDKFGIIFRYNKNNIICMEALK